MRRCAAILLALALLAALPLCARADGQKLLYPGTAVENSDVYVMCVPLSSGTVDVFAGDVSIAGSAATRAEANLGITFYCVVDTSRSFSNYQKEQQRAGLNALSDALGDKDSMVLITMGRETVFGEKLTDPAQRKAAIEAACTYDSLGTNLYEAIDYVIKTVAEQESGFSCIIFFTDGIDESQVVKVNEDQVGRIIQGSGMCINFVALLTQPVTSYASGKAERLARFATLSLGGTCRTPIREGDGSVSAVEPVVRDMVNATADWTALRLNADQIPRTGKTVELSLTWQGEGRTVTDTVTLNTADLPPIPETEPVTEPVTLPPTQPPETIPPITQPTGTIPEYHDEQVEQARYYTLIGFSVIGVLIVLAIVIVIADKRRGRRIVMPAPERLDVPPRNPSAAPQLPQEDKQVPMSANQLPLTQQEDERPPIVLPPKESRQLPPSDAAPEETPKEETPVSEEKEHQIAEKDDEAALTDEEKYRGSFLGKKKRSSLTDEDTNLMAYLEGDSSLSLDQLFGDSALTQPQDVPEQSPAEEIAAEQQPEVPEPPQQPIVQQSESEQQTPPPLRQESQRPARKSTPQSATEEWDLTQELREPEEETQSEKKPDGATSRIAELFGHREQKAEHGGEKRNERERDSLHQSVSALRAAQRRSAQAERALPSQDAPVPPPAAAPRPSRPGGCTVRLTPEGNPAGTVYVTMEMGGSRTLGRNNKSDIILNPRDTSLSGLHFELQWDGRVLYLTDRGSTNGTSLTGIPQRPGHWSRIDSGSTIQAGSTRYKVKITRQ